MLFTLLAIAAAAWLVYKASQPSRLPPGPPGIPLLGNVLEMPSKLLFLKLDEWKKQYGDIMCLNLAGTKLIVLNSAKVASDILDGQSNVTSGRPRLVMAGEVMSNDLLPAFMPYGDAWRRFRRATHEVFNLRSATAFYPMQESEAVEMVRGLLEDQSDIEKHFARLATSVTWRVLYGGPAILNPEETKVKMMDDMVLSIAKAAAPMAFMVDVFPIMKSLPTWAAGWKAYGVDFYHRMDSYLMELLVEGRQHKDDGSFVASCAALADKFGVSDQEIAWAAGGHFAAGVETTATVLTNFIKAMILFPDAAKKGQAEVDAVCGNRPPTFADRDQLPYVQATAKEALRWRAVVPGGVPHAATETFTYGEYVIPKGAIIMDNIWSISRDPELFPDFEAFNPDRYINPEVKGQPKDDIYAYSHGRRICPGRDIANNSLYIDIAYLLWAFDFCKAVDASGNEITPPLKGFVDMGLAIHPEPFPYLLKPRRKDLGELLMHHLEANGIASTPAAFVPNGTSNGVHKTA